MRSYLLFILLIIQSGTLVAQVLAPQHPAPLYQHLYEINAEWLPQATPVEYQEIVRFATDRERIQRHLQLVEDDLRNRPMTQWSVEQQAQRIAVLDILRAYWQAGSFPLNRVNQKRLPIFIDPDDTACAVGHLMRETGAVALTEQIRTENNYAYIEELLCYSGVSEWATNHGFTSDELAWIQPGYSVVHFEASPLGTGLGINRGRGDATVYDMEEMNDYLLFAGDFQQLDTFMAQGLAAWDGLDWKVLPGASPRWIAALSYDIATEILYAYGDFPSLGSDTLGPVLASHDGQDWQLVLSTQDVEVEGDSLLIRDLICIQGDCYLASNITSYAENPLGALVIWSETEGQLRNWSEEYQLVGEVFDIDHSGDTLVVGGNFVLFEGSDSLAQDMVLLHNNPSRFMDEFSDLFRWSDISVSMVEAVSLVDFGVNEKQIAFAVKREDGLIVGNTGTGIDLLSADTSDYQIGGIVPGTTLLYGFFPVYWSTTSYGLVNLITEFGGAYKEVATVDLAVTALHIWRGELILAGHFHNFDDGEYPAVNLATASLLISDTEEQSTSFNFCSVATDGYRIYLRDIPTEANEIYLEIFDQQGRLVQQQNLNTFGQDQEISVDRLPAASYVYRLRWDTRIQTGQVVVMR